MIIHLGTIAAGTGGDLICYRIRPDPFPGFDTADICGWWPSDKGVIPPGARCIWTRGAKPYWGDATILRYWVEVPLKSH